MYILIIFLNEYFSCKYSEILHVSTFASQSFLVYVYLEDNTKVKC